MGFFYACIHDVRKMYVHLFKIFIMATQIRTAKARFDTKLSKEQKEFFEYAASLGGFRTLTEFVIHALKEKADKIISEHKTIIASQKDREIFFEALINPPEPNARLKKAAARYKENLDK